MSSCAAGIVTRDSSFPHRITKAAFEALSIAQSFSPRGSSFWLPPSDPCAAFAVPICIVLSVSLFSHQYELSNAFSSFHFLAIAIATEC